MAVKLSNAGKPKPAIEALMDALQPALIGFGPLFMIMGLQRGSNNLAWYGYPFSLVGCFMLSVGLTTLYIKQKRIEARLNELERLKS